MTCISLIRDVKLNKFKRQYGDIVYVLNDLDLHLGAT